MIFTHSKNIFDTVSIARKMPRGRHAGDAEPKSNEPVQDGLGLESEKTTTLGNMDPVVQHHSNV